MRHARVLGVFTFAVVMFALSPTRAFDDRFHGSVCVGKTAADAGRLAYDNWGVRNASTSDFATVICPMGYMSNGASFGATIWHDHSTHVVRCTYFVGDHGGNQVFSGGGFNPGLAPWRANPYQDNSQLGTQTGYLFLECELPPTISGNSSYVASVYLDD